jgi:hypothetical protein
MTFTVGFGPQWSREWKSYQPDQKLKVGEFIHLYQANGLDPTVLPGRISPSWMNLQSTHPNFAYAKNNFLWHYHIGLPQYTKSVYGDRTSDWVLHFQWVGRGSHIDLLELSTHQVMGKFYLPRPVLFHLLTPVRRQHPRRAREACGASSIKPTPSARTATAPPPADRRSDGASAGIPP